MSEYRIVAKIDPQTSAGAQRVRADLKGIAGEASTTKAAISQAFDQSQFDRSIGSLVSRLDTLQTSLLEVTRTNAQVATSNGTMAASLDQLATAGIRAGGGLDKVNDSSRKGAAGASAFDASLRRVLQAVDQEAAELTRLNQLLAEAKVLHERGAISALQYERVQTLVNDGVKRNTVSLGQQRAGYTQLGFQVQDITQTLALGINPLVVLAQQGGQTASALSLAFGEKGALGKAATFMAGPAGSIILATVAVFGQLAYAAFKSGSAIEEATNKLKKDAQETEIARQAKDRYAKSEEGVIAAVRARIAALTESEKAERSQAERDNEAAENSLKKALNIRAETQAILERTLALREAANAPGPGGEFAAGGAAGGLAQLEVERAQRKVDENAKAIRDSQTLLNKSRIELANEAAERQTDSSKRINHAYDEEVRKANEVVRSLRTVSKERQRALEVQIAGINTRRKAELEAASASESARRSETRGGPLTSFISPVQGRVSSGFGPRKAPTAGASTFHNGIDIAAPTGTPVKSAAAGVVIYAGKLAGLGNAIIVDHGGGTITEYGHLSQILTKKNALVAQGDKIGEVGSTGISTGAHLDYRVKVGGRYVDPRRGRFRTDETAANLRAGRAGQTADDSAERRAEQERDFVSGVQNSADARGRPAEQSLNAQIARVLAEFRRRFNREPSAQERTAIGDALTDAQAREIAQRFQEAYVDPLQRLQDLQGVSGQDREVLNAKLAESDRIGRALTQTENEQIDASIRQSEALGRQADILAEINGPVEQYRQQLEALNRLLEQGAISQTQYNSKVSDLGQASRDLTGSLPGQDFFGRNFADTAAKDQAGADRDKALATLETTSKASGGEFGNTGLDYNAKKLAIERQYNDKLRQIMAARRDIQVGTAQDIAGSLLQIAEDSAGKQSGIYKALFVVEKAISIARSIMAIQTGIALAASQKFPESLVAIASVVAATANIVSSIQAVKLAFKDGGYVSGPGGPRSDSVDARLSNGEFVVNAKATERNRTLLEAINSGSVGVGARGSSANDNPAPGQVRAVAGGDTYSITVGDVIVQGGAAGDGVSVGRNVREAITGIVREEIVSAKRAGGALTKTNSSVMTG